MGEAPFEVAHPRHRGRFVYHRTWDIEGSPDRPPGTGMRMPRTPIRGVVPGRGMRIPVPGGAAVLKQPSL